MTPPPPGARLRPLRADDLGAIAGLENAVFGGEAWSQGMLARELAAAQAPQPDRAYVVVEEDRAAGTDGRGPASSAPPEPGPALILGYAGLWFGDGRGDADLLTIATAPSARRRGVGAAMLDHLLDVARWAGCRSVLLEVRASNEDAQAMYKRFGFEAIGVRRRYYLAPVEDAVVMRRHLPGARPPGPVGAECST